MAKNEVAEKKQGGALAVIDFAADAGMGMEGMTSQDMAIPFFNILQKLSPQLDTLTNAKAGMIFNTVTEEVFKDITVIPCAYKREFVEWKPREQGGGLVGQHAITSAAVTEAKNVNGKLTTASGNILVETAYHFVLRVELDTGLMEPGLITMSSTQLKKARKWLTQMQSLQAKGKNGMFTLPMMSHKYRLRTVEERNDKGSWFGWDITREGPLDMADEADLFEMALNFAKSIKAGEVKVKEEMGEESFGKSSNARPVDDDNVPF